MAPAAAAAPAGERLVGKDAGGKDTYAAEELWQRTRGEDGSHSGYYAGAVSYWDKQEASHAGVLGGFEAVSPYDISDSKALLRRVMKAQLAAAAAGERQLTVVDCGAGVGRVSELLLLHHFRTVDLLEPSRHLLDAARKNLRAAIAAKTYPDGHGLGELMCLGLQDFDPAPGRYDAIWIQWAALYLTDGDAVALFRRCRRGLTPDGLVVVKENVCESGGDFVADADDNSVTRSDAYMRTLFARGGLELVHAQQQRNWPSGLFPVMMWALRPAPGGEEDGGAQDGAPKKKQEAAAA